jgi:hypothetical protein
MGLLYTLIEKTFDPDLLYNKIVHYYVDKKGFSKEKANQIAQNVIKREHERRKCKNFQCGHSLDDHVRNVDTCLILNCVCRKFVK